MPLELDSAANADLITPWPNSRRTQPAQYHGRPEAAEALTAELQELL